MPIQLTTPIQTGAIDPNGPYEQVKIIIFSLNTVVPNIEILCQYGNTVESVWVPGVRVGDVADQAFRIEGDDYDVMTAVKSVAADEVYYDETKELLYQWLLDNDHYIGTIV